jgi:hypothetical protein
MASTKQPIKGKPPVDENKSVIALRDGYFGRYRVAGEQFEVPADLNASWFVDATPIEKPEAEKSEASDLV